MSETRAHISPGQRVAITQAAIDAGLKGTWHGQPMYSTGTAIRVDDTHIWVQRDRRTGSERYAREFWQPEDDEPDQVIAWAELAALRKDRERLESVLAAARDVCEKGFPVAAFNAWEVPDRVIHKLIAVIRDIDAAMNTKEET